jgi:hypothetical protein
MTPRSWTERKRRTLTQAPHKIHSSRTGKLVMDILALIAEFENDIRRERRERRPSSCNQQSTASQSFVFLDGRSKESPEKETRGRRKPVGALASHRK